MSTGGSQVTSRYVTVSGESVVGGHLLRRPPAVLLLVCQGLDGVCASVEDSATYTGSGFLLLRGGRCCLLLSPQLYQCVAVLFQGTVCQPMQLVSCRSML